MRFKVGDRVRCVVRTGALVLGAKYIISKCEHIGYVEVAGLEGEEWWTHRFEPIPRTVAPENRSRVDAGPSWGF